MSTLLRIRQSPLLDNLRVADKPGVIVLPPPLPDTGQTRMSVVHFVSSWSVAFHR